MIAHILRAGHRVDAAGEGTPPRRLVLHAVERRADDVLWLRYRVAEP